MNLLIRELSIGRKDIKMKLNESYKEIVDELKPTVTPEEVNHVGYSFKKSGYTESECECG